jgi:hypothetical protein
MVVSHLYRVPPACRYPVLEIASQRGGGAMAGHRIFAMSFARIHELYVQKVERKGHSRAESMR